MALKVWLPLNGDLHNQGASDIEITNSGATVNNAGKIGSCYSFDGSDDFISLAGTTLYNLFTGGSNTFSICMWIYHNDTTRAVLFGDYGLTNSIGLNIELSTAHRIRFYWNGSPDKNFNAESDVGLQIWTHICLTYDGTTLRLYRNSVLSSDTWTGPLAEKLKTAGVYYLGRDSRTGATAFNGRLNDFRIYDHCLSAAEVKEIAQGLVLHYKLNGFMGGTNDNLAQGSKLLTTTSSVTNCNISKRGSPTVETRTDGFAQLKGTAAWQGFSLWSNGLNLKVGTTYTYSFYGYTELSTSTDAGVSFYPMMYNSAGTRDTSSKMPISVMGDAFTNANARQIGKLSTTPQLYWASFTWNQTMANILTNGGKIELSIQIHGTFNTGRTDYLWAPKLEVGEKPTDWTPSIEEMGIDITKIEDSSGYNHNGTTLNTVEVSSDTPRYNTSTNLVNGNSMINCGRGGMVTDSITVNFWCKYSTWGNPASCTEGGGWNFENNGGSITFPVYISSIGYVHSKNGTDAEQLPPADYANAWHMFTGTYNRVEKTVSLYVDGELKQQNIASAGNNITYNSSNVIWLGAEATGSATAASNGMAGLFSDFRIYCTALLDTDIKQLYNVGMKVDNLGEIHTYELEESGSKELIAGHPLNTNYSIHNEDRNWYNGYVNGEIYLNANMTSVGTGYIPVSPTGKTYYYDIDYSVNAGNQLYIQVERYDANKTARTNSAAVTILSTKPSSDVSHKHIFGTVDLSTDGVNPCAFISLRILNGWNGTASGTIGISTIHKISIKEVSSFQNPKTHKNGVLLLDELKEYQKPSFYKNGYIEATQFIER